MSAHPADGTDSDRHLAKVRVAGSNPVVRSKALVPGQGLSRSPGLICVDPAGLPMTCPWFCP